MGGRLREHGAQQRVQPRRRRRRGVAVRAREYHPSYQHGVDRVESRATAAGGRSHVSILRVGLSGRLRRVPTPTSPASTSLRRRGRLLLPL
ncbi:hypothetical protein ACFPRL_08645 [Pseudoclavibacter helvolus]